MSDNASAAPRALKKCITCDANYIVCGVCRRDDSLRFSDHSKNIVCDDCPGAAAVHLSEDREHHQQCKACRVAYACRVDGCDVFSKVSCRVCTKPMAGYCKAHVGSGSGVDGKEKSQAAMTCCHTCYKRHCDVCKKIADVTCRRCASCDAAQCRECFEYNGFLARYTEKGAIVESFCCNKCNVISPEEMDALEPVFTLMDVDLSRCMAEDVPCKHLCTFMVYPHRLTIQTLQALDFIKDIALGGVSVGTGTGTVVSIQPSAHIMSRMAAGSNSELRAHIDAELYDDTSSGELSGDEEEL